MLFIALAALGLAWCAVAYMFVQMFKNEYPETDDDDIRWNSMTNAEKRQYLDNDIDEHMSMRPKKE